MKKEAKILMRILNKVYTTSSSEIQMYLRLHEVLEYFGGNKTTEFNNKMEREFEELKELN